jgi:hypothetical protein
MHAAPHSVWAITTLPRVGFLPSGMTTGPQLSAVPSLWLICIALTATTQCRSASLKSSSLLMKAQVASAGVCVKLDRPEGSTLSCFLTICHVMHRVTLFTLQVTFIVIAGSSCFKTLPFFVIAVFASISCCMPHTQKFVFTAHSRSYQDVCRGPNP